LREVILNNASHHRNLTTIIFSSCKVDKLKNKFSHKNKKMRKMAVLISLVAVLALFLCVVYVENSGNSLRRVHRFINKPFADPATDIDARCTQACIAAKADRCSKRNDPGVCCEKAMCLTRNRSCPSKYLVFIEVDSLDGTSKHACSPAPYEEKPRNRMPSGSFIGKSV
jgi:hypothetical protein